MNADEDGRMAEATRYAIYLAPERDHPLHAFGAEFLGYDAETGRDCPQPRLDGIPAERLREVTTHPRLYGFHLTLKAPFRLAEGMDRSDLERALVALAAAHPPMAPMALALESRPAGAGQRFHCLVPAERHAALHALEAEAVLALDALRAPLNAQELARRRPEALPPRERSLLERHGYPHVLECFAPHFSLTGAAAEDKALATAIEAHWMRYPEAHQLEVRSLALFEQPGAGARFVLRKRSPLGG